MKHRYSRIAITSLQSVSQYSRIAITSLHVSLQWSEARPTQDAQHHIHVVNSVNIHCFVATNIGKCKAIFNIDF